MKKWDKGRLAAYAAFGVASVVSLVGLADFDAATGAFDLRPFNIYAAVGASSGVGASALAAVALVRGWGR